MSLDIVHWKEVRKEQQSSLFEVRAPGPSPSSIIHQAPINKTINMLVIIAIVIKKIRSYQVLAVLILLSTMVCVHIRVPVLPYRTPESFVRIDHNISATPILSPSNSATFTKFIIHTSQCNENVTSNWRKTSLSSIKNWGVYAQYHQLSQIVEGPALKHGHIDNAICEFRPVRYWQHFPHA
jgi:hypothetical protein